MASTKRCLSLCSHCMAPVILRCVYTIRTTRFFVQFATIFLCVDKGLCSQLVCRMPYSQISDIQFYHPSCRKHSVWYNSLLCHTIYGKAGALKHSKTFDSVVLVGERWPELLFSKTLLVWLFLWLQCLLFDEKGFRDLSSWFGFLLLFSILIECPVVVLRSCS